MEPYTQIFCRTAPLSDNCINLFYLVLIMWSKYEAASKNEINIHLAQLEKNLKLGTKFSD